MASAELKELVELAKEAGLEGTELSNFLLDERTRQREREKEDRERQREHENEEREREEKEGNASVNGRKRNVNGRKRSVNITENERRPKVMLCNERLTDATI